DVQGEIFRAVERTGVVPVAAASRGANRGRSLLGVFGERRRLAIRRIGDHPRAAVLRVVVLVPVRRSCPRGVVGGAADRLRRFLLTLSSLLDQPLEIGGGDVFLALAGKLRRLLHRDAAFVAVGIRALKIWIAPGCPWNAR